MREDREQGGLTGATGSLTPSDPDDEFVPAETREISDPDGARQVTGELHRQAAEHGVGGPAGAAGPEPVSDDKPQSTRSGGYGSGTGLSADDPAYRMEERAVPPAERPAGTETILGGDERHDPDEEHF
jgi:hypothetical protein